MSFDDIKALAHPVLRHRVLTNFRAESEGVTTRRADRRAAQDGAAAEVGDVKERTSCEGSRRAGRRVRARSLEVDAVRSHHMETHVVPGARFVDPKVLARIKDLELLARYGRRRVHQRPAPRAVLRRVDRLRRASRLRGRRRHPPRGLAAVRAHRPVLRQAVRGGHQRQLLGPARRLEVDGRSRARASRSSSTASSWRRASRTCRTGSAIASASSRSTRTS